MRPIATVNAILEWQPRDDESISDYHSRLKQAASDNLDARRALKRLEDSFEFQKAKELNAP